MSEKAKSAQDDKVLAVVATIPLVGLIMFYAMSDASDFVKHYAKQSTGLFAIWIVSFVIAIVPIVGWLVSCVLSLVVLIGWILLVIKALSGEKYSLPVVSEYLDKYMK
ncbi:MAG: hypothetical protein QY330_02505 [Candidatus Dojkabacteria bacterium]|uniref:DUF4870 domain-containing protein n=1 Tax=Candidatus Dojkabacteria bacterium TaxID=2099670 RepID=A0A952DVW5_9BACT|nr:hypothetical protein [Candidatus Dojkabacteria bacterium]WKZ28447.1 MAG: hypothetical protein QY330_02505 [Candidatus Dojkabacteria bacterium]